MRKRSAAAIIITIVLIIIILWIVLFWGRGKEANDKNEYTGEALTNQEQVVQNDNINDKYYVVLTDEGTKIYYTRDMSIYDYAELNTNQLPPDVYEKLKEGMYISDDENLYNFLESYSS